MIDSYIGDSIESCVCVAAINKRNENKRKKNAKKNKVNSEGQTETETEPWSSYSFQVQRKSKRRSDEKINFPQLNWINKLDIILELPLFFTTKNRILKVKLSLFILFAPRVRQGFPFLCTRSRHFVSNLCWTFCRVIHRSVTQHYYLKHDPRERIYPCHSQCTILL